jgi:hypothetical protein
VGQLVALALGLRLAELLELELAEDLLLPLSELEPLPEAAELRLRLREAVKEGLMEAERDMEPELD